MWALGKVGSGIDRWCRLQVGATKVQGKDETSESGAVTAYLGQKAIGFKKVCSNSGVGISRSLVFTAWDRDRVCPGKGR